MRECPYISFVPTPLSDSLESLLGVAGDPRVYSLGVDLESRSRDALGGEGRSGLLLSRIAICWPAARFGAPLLGV